ncbi:MULTISPECIES: hypothetical protein [unclassified Polaromonas]|jgi:hypothetical protein|uniref:hypothetical protein n=1 Tax=unclassified Polaromonas TaxID=2638319 RepID=UPI000BCC10CC|nr:MULTISPECIES: hypothetical protein [unclassified Polaromonas]OYY34508.1 MAG: hypothetical protein B7Y60_15580 [Polaromonas sp. 35-63-35]OYZ18835.1 MAG: hypothetical protein B7Y28_14415 [Polaromonas sp. 16-63-31]OZA49553.1 MAG: hypothetical protein B7X88_14120 [Polaromonas sp. 17-63-33]HQR97487.1 hypothetical protein [Polaromonas sp.]HQS38711.1 hypothetical protein [Polaromonas sp.]
MPGLGKDVKVDFSSVKKSAANTVTFLGKKLPKIPMRRFGVIFLGERHNDPLDQAVTSAVLLNPPVMKAGLTRVIFERGLDNVAAYIPSPAFADTRVEPMHVLSAKARSSYIADMILDAFTNHGRDLVYVVCGSAHAMEIFHSLDKRFGHAFTYIYKMSSTE